MSLRRTVGAVGALLTCPCHAVPLALLLAGGTAGGAWLTRNLPVVLLALLALFALSLWLLFRSGPVAAGVVAGPPGPGGIGGATPCEACGQTDPTVPPQRRQ